MSFVLLCHNGNGKGYLLPHRASEVFGELVKGCVVDDFTKELVANRSLLVDFPRHRIGEIVSTLCISFAPFVAKDDAFLPYPSHVTTERTEQRPHGLPWFLALINSRVIIICIDCPDNIVTPPARLRCVRQ